jgi:hypothetical protein
MKNNMYIAAIVLLLIAALFAMSNRKPEMMGLQMRY